MEPDFKPWTLTVCGESFQSDHVTLALAIKVEDETGIRWPALRIAANLTNTASVLLKVAAVLLADRTGVSVDEARAKLEGLTYDELDEAVILTADDKPTSYEDGFPPSAGEGSTPT